MRTRVIAVTALWLVGIVLAGCSEQQKLDTRSRQAFKSIEGKTHSAVTPAPRPGTWINRHNTINTRLKEGNVGMLFVGDSITQGWEGAGRDVWNTYYAKRNAANFGISGDWTQHVLWRIDHSDFNNVHPKLAVVMIGTNNAPQRAGSNTAEEIADGIIAVCQRLRTRLPETKILLLGIFPRDANAASPLRTKNAKASLLASAVADNRNIFYMDIGGKFLTKDGELTKQIMPDFLHPNAAGYKIWAEAIEPQVAKLMGDDNLGAVKQPPAGNKPERLEWFRDLGFGLFIHWSVDSQIGSVISHSMVGADEAYLKHFIEDLPRTFNPHKFNPQDWAVLARLAGVRYVVFTTKHHSGFCMFDTATTDFNIMNTPFKRDITKEILDAFRSQGIAPGVYFSPDDFLYLHRTGTLIQRSVPEVQPSHNPGLLALDKAQIRELMTKYGDIDIVFFDGEATDLRTLAWQIRPDVVVTRGALETPEQYVPGVPLEGAWESNLTMGTQWQYKPTNEVYKSGGYCIELLVETRAKGGNLLLNIGPKPDGELAIEQEERLREIALWMFVNSECIYAVRPWIITNEQDIWFTKQKDQDTLYAIVKQNPVWPYGQWRDIVLHSVLATDQTQVSVLGQNDKVLEYQSVVPKTTWKQESDGLHVRAMHAQRLYNNRKWPNPIVLKLTHVKPALTPPRVDTLSARWDGAAKVARLQGRLLSMGDVASLQVGFEYRDVTGQDLQERTAPWVATQPAPIQSPGEFSSTANDLQAGHAYEMRAFVKHPLLTLYGKQVSVRVP